MAIHDDNEKLAVVVGKEDEDKAKSYTDAYKASVQFIDQLTSKCDEIQIRVLEEILSHNVETEYLKRHGMSRKCIDRQKFKCKVPLVTYEQIKPDIIRIYNGDFSPILCAQPISELWISSGTSEGQGKLFPATEDEMHRRHNVLTSVMPFIKRRIKGPSPEKGKTLSFLITREEIVTPGGLIARPGLNSVFKNPQFYKDDPFPFNHNTSPIEAIYCPDHFQSIYTQLLCGFYQRVDVTLIKAVFGSNLIWAINFLKCHYLELCYDISFGSLSPKIIDPALRSYMTRTFMLNPRPQLAKVIEKACVVGEDWEGIFKKIWPNVEYLETVVTGSMAQYIPMLNYYSGGLPLVSIKYSASECDMGFNLNPMCDPNDISYTLMPNMAYYEFMPLESLENESSNLQPKMVDLANVEVGKEYEVVVTTYCGLYRYRLGDVLSPTSFYNSTPQFKFVRKRDVLLSIDVAKTTEIELQDAIDKASSILQTIDTKVVEYTSYADVSNIPGHYVIYVELTTIERVHQEILDQCCYAMEGSFGVRYRNGRVEQSIGPLEIRVVSIGTFEKLRDYAISKDASFMQFKVPRCVKLLPMLELLNAGVVSTHFSPSVPGTVHNFFSNNLQI